MFLYNSIYIVNSIYLLLYLKGAEMKTMDKKYLSTADTAKLLRVALKKAFPGKKFSVRSEVYSGGSSINVSWTHGLPEKEVEAIAKQYEGAGFDGMVDYKYYKSSWLLPNGEVFFAGQEGSSDTGGMHQRVDIEDKPPHKDAVLVHMGADFVFCKREVSDELQIQVAKDLAKAMEVDFVDMNQRPMEHSHDNWWNLTHKWMYSKNLDNYAGIARNEEITCGHWEEFYLMVEKPNKFNEHNNLVEVK